MSHFVKVATKSEIEAGSGRKVEVNGKEIALFNIGGSFCAIDDTCSHRGGPLSEGSMEDNVVTCPWHGSKWDVTNGSLTWFPAKLKPADTFKVSVEGDTVYVEV